MLRWLIVASLVVLGFLVMFMLVVIFFDSGSRISPIPISAGLIGIVGFHVRGRRSQSRLLFLFMAAASGLASILATKVWSLVLFYQDIPRAMAEEVMSRDSADSMRALQDTIGELIVRFSIPLAGAVLVLAASALAVRHARVLKELPPVP